MNSMLRTAWRHGNRPKPARSAVLAAPAAVLPACRLSSLPSTQCHPALSASSPSSPRRYTTSPRLLFHTTEHFERKESKQVRPSHATKRNYQVFQALVESHLTKVFAEMGPWAQNQDEYRPFGLTSQQQLDKEVKLFRMVLDKAFKLAVEDGKLSRQDNPLFWGLRNAFIKQDATGLRRELKYAFQTFLMRSRFPKAINELHMALADLRFPYEWYPATRMMQRTFHLHVGPTNSGKTYNALKALENARTGIYAGPLRLLAHETWTRFKAKNKPCALITGEELRIPENTDTWFHSCTVEMTPLNTRVDVAVIDEIQMIANDERGWAWTQAVLGVQAKEVHLCGEERVVDLIQNICARLGEKCIVHRYNRLNGLEVEKNSLKGSFRNLRKGDAVVSFSRLTLHQLKAGIEHDTGRRCAIVYGSLPPETRASQAALFNDPDNEYDFLVASDAIGMGLNLEVRRVVFETVHKFDGTNLRQLSVPEIKQIGGRAGRYRTAAKANVSDEEANQPPPPGLVTALDDEDLRVIRKAFNTDVSPIKTAGLRPPPAVLERFHAYFPPKTPTTFVLARLREMGRLSGLFHMCDISDALQIAELIKPYDLSIPDRCVFLHVPINLRDSKQVDVLKAFAKCVAEMGSGHLLDFPELDLEALEAPRPKAGQQAQDYLRRLESLHQAITMYLWLSYRYQGVFQSQNLAFKVKQMVEDKIADHLEQLNFVPEKHRARRKFLREKAAQAEEKEREVLGDEVEAVLEEEGVHDEGVGHWNEEGHEESLFETPDGEVSPNRGNGGEKETGQAQAKPA